jgi:SAM-dependent methyltransferase
MSNGGLSGSVLDVGCSTGEFLQHVEWSGKKYGIEVNAAASEMAEKSGISMLGTIDELQVKVDTIIFRGVIQHVPDPFEYLHSSYEALAPGGRLIFLATPNSESLVYRLFGNLPALDRQNNYWIPGRRELELYCAREGFLLADSRFPYRNSGYSKWSDSLSFAKALVTPKGDLDFAFPRNMMDLVFFKSSKK